MIFAKNLKFVLLTVGFIGCQLGASHAFAEHTWANYKWEVSEPLLALELVDNLTTGVWSTALVTARNDWRDWNFDNDGTEQDQPILNSVLNLTLDTSGTNPACDPVSNSVEVCNGEYGANGWLGIAQIEVDPIPDTVIQHL